MIQEQLENKYIPVCTPSVISFILFNRASLDFVKKDNKWLFQSNKGIKFTSPRNAVRIARVMKKHESV